jgi:uncharacterized SAM-dependent methyltransferase
MDAFRNIPAADPAFRRDVLAGLAAPIPAVPARWLYDRRGSELFEQITELPEYYPTRTERALLELHCPELAGIAGTGDAVVEFGSGSSSKTPILLRAVKPSAYVPIDISGEFLRHSADGLGEEFPNLPIHPVEADFMRPITLPEAWAPPQSSASSRLNDRQSRSPNCRRSPAGDEGDARRGLIPADRNGPIKPSTCWFGLMTMLPA